MSNVISFILGMFIMSASALAALHFSDTHHDLLTVFFVGPIGWLYLAIGWPVVKVYKTVTLWYFRQNFIRCRFYIKDGYSQDTWYIHKDVVEFFYHKGENHDERCITEESDCKNARSVPYKFSDCIGKNGWMYVGDRQEQWKRTAALSTIRPYTEFYRKIEFGG